MAQAKDGAQIWKILQWTLIGSMCGLMMGATICFLKPKLYRSRAVIAKSEKSDQETTLSVRRAAQISRLLDLGMKWGISEPEIIERLRRNVRFKPLADRVEITAVDIFKEDARDIALELGRLFRGMDEERFLDGKPAELSPMGEEELLLIRNRIKIEGLMQDELDEAGKGRSIDRIWRLVCDGEAESKAMWEAESFQLHWKYYEDATSRLIEEPVSPMLPMIEVPAIAEKAFSPNVDLHLQPGLLLGTLVGVLFGVRRSRLLPNVPDPIVASPQLPPSLTENPPPAYSPEDDW